jgi:uncharacterized membrane protein
MEARELKSRIGIFVICLISLWIAFFSVGVASLDWSIVAFVGLIALYQAFNLYELYMDIFKRNKYSLDNL